MKKLLIILSVFICLSSYGQSIAHIGAIASSAEAAAPSSNMISNGTFATAADWDFSAAGWSYSSNAALFTDGAGSGGVLQTDANMNSSIEASTNYRLAFDIASTGTANISIQNSALAVTYIGADNYTADSYILYFKSVADVGVAGIDFYASDGSTDANFTIDNIDLTERTLGTEIITDGTFTADNSDWVLGAAWTYDATNNEADYDYTSSSDLEQTDAVMAGTMEVSTDYNITFTIRNASGVAGFDIENYNKGSQYVAQDTYSDGTYSIDFTTTSDIGVGGICFDTSSSGSTSSFSITNISLKKYQTD